MWGPRQKLFVSASLGLWLLVVVWFATFCWFRGIRSVEALRNYASMASLDDPVVVALANGEILPGSPIEDLLAIRQPTTTKNYGRLVVHQYSPDFSYDYLQVQVLDGRVAAAYVGSCTWHWDFFDEVPADVSAAAANIRSAQAMIERFPEKSGRIRKALHSNYMILGIPVDDGEAEESTSR